MSFRWYRCTTVVLCLSLAGCAGVPALYADHQPSKPGIQAITRQISCELHSSARMADLANRNYFVTVLLTLQVDDNVDFTPSLGFIHPFSAAMTNLTASVGGDLGGARRRTFTTTYTLDVAELERQLAAPPPPKPGDAPAVPPDNWCTNAHPDAKKSFALNGNLGLGEIVDDGLGIIDPNHKAIHTASGPTDKAGPSFGSYVQLIITRSMTSLGPVWTVKRFKGPGGTNGLFNAKRLDTDSVLLTFAPQPPTGGQTPQQVLANSRLNLEQKAAGDTFAAVGDAAAKARHDVEAARTARALATARRLRVRKRVADQRKAAALQAEIAAQASTEQLRVAQAAAETAQLRLSAAQTAAAVADQDAAATQAQAPATAINATQSLQQTMLLQNLAGSLTPH